MYYKKIKCKDRLPKEDGHYITDILSDHFYDSDRKWWWDKRIKGVSKEIHPEYWLELTVAVLTITEEEIKDIIYDQMKDYLPRHSVAFVSNAEARRVEHGDYMIHSKLCLDTAKAIIKQLTKEE